jgi:metallophosphoesterase superfamily enzyme
MALEYPSPNPEDYPLEKENPLLSKPIAVIQLENDRLTQRLHRLAKRLNVVTIGDMKKIRRDLLLREKNVYKVLVDALYAWYKDNGLE